MTQCTKTIPDLLRGHSGSLAALQSAANQILSVLSPASSRLVRVMVLLQKDVGTASTDGNLLISLPSDFCGHAIPDDASVSVGLLAHEAGHFVHPLEDIKAVERDHGVPNWLANVALDVHGESFVESAFPAMVTPLQTTRRAVSTAHLDGYRQILQEAQDFQQAAAAATLVSRFSEPDVPFAMHWIERHTWLAFPWRQQATRFLQDLAVVAALSAHQLPACLRTLIATFPELKQTPRPALPDYGQISSDRLGQVALAEARLGGLGCKPSGTGRLHERHFSREAPEVEALHISQRIRSRFEAGAGILQVSAPGQIDRHALARGHPLPFYMRLPGKSQPAAKVVLCLDISGSMGNRKLALARVSGQAIALAIAKAGGHIVGVLFSDDGIIATGADQAPLFAPLREWYPRGGTSFQFLAHVWRRWPQHLVLLLTDGYGEAPVAFPTDRQRTYVVLIQGDPAELSAIAYQVLSLADLRELPSLLAMLIPRRHL